MKLSKLCFTSCTIFCSLIISGYLSQEKRNSQPIYNISSTDSAGEKPPEQSRGTASQPDMLTISGSPLTIQVGSNASIQVYHTNYSHGQVFGDADSGIFVWIGSNLYGSNLAGTNDISAGLYTLDLTKISHSGPYGQGTENDPWVVTTILDGGIDGLRITQRVEYIDGYEFFHLSWDITNNSTSPISFDFFHAADFYFADSDNGFGYYDPVSGAIGGYNLTQDWYMSFIPEASATHYQEAGYYTIWEAIGQCTTTGSCSLGTGFNDTINSDLLDNGAGLQWHKTLSASESITLGDWWTFGDRPPIVPQPEATIRGRASVTFWDLFLDEPTVYAPLPGAMVSLLRNDQIVESKSTLDDGTYQFRVNDYLPTDIYRVRVDLLDQAHTPKVFQVRYSGATNDPVVFAQTQSFNILTDDIYVKNVSFSADNIETDPNIPLTDLTDVAVIYYHTYQVVDFILRSPPDGLGATLDYLLPVDVYAFDENDGVYYQLSDSSIHISADNDESDFDSGDRPMNREWHEMFHHLMRDIIDIPAGTIGDCNHAGYLNFSTSDSWTEGWSEAWATILQDILGYPNADESHIYTYGFFSEVSIEQNYRVWDNFETRWTFLCENRTGSWEEFAVAALIWDMYDPASTQDVFGMQEDTLDLSLADMWAVLTNEDPNSLNNMKDVFDSLQSQGIGSNDSDNDGQSNLEETFILHGFYADDGDHIYQSNEDVGWGGQALRWDWPQIPGAAIVVNLTKPNGTPVSCNPGYCPKIRVDVEFDPPNDYFSYSYMVSLAQGSNNLIGFSPPPTSMAATLNITLFTGGQVDEAYSISNQEFWSLVSTTDTDYVAEVTLTYTPRVFLPLTMRQLPNSDTIIEEFNSSSGFTQTDPDVYIDGGQVHWSVSRSGGSQFVYRSIPAFSGDVRLTVRGQINTWTNNCGVWAGIGDNLGTGISVNFAFTGGGCPTQGPLVMANGATWDYYTVGCNYYGPWLWINDDTFYEATLTISSGSATLGVPGIGTAYGSPTYYGTYNTLYVGYTGDGDWPSCSGTIDSMIIEPLD